METIREWDVKLRLVKTRRGVQLYVIDLDDRFFIEQNPFKESKYGMAYRKLKSLYPDLYMFWEIRKNLYTGRMLIGSFLRKQQIDPFITQITETEDFLRFADVRDEEEKEEISHAREAGWPEETDE